MFVLAHLSDPHLAPLPAPRFDELLSKRAVGAFNWLRKRGAIHQPAVLAATLADLRAQQYDHLAVTGDLINIGLAAEYLRARAWLEALGPPDRVTLVPGNHDIYVKATADWPQRQWASYMRGDGPNSFPFVRRRGPAALIGLSTAVPTLPFYATGTLGAAQLDKLASILPALKAEGLFRIVLIHHPPVTRAARALKRLTDAAALRAVLRQHGADLLIHGHDHVRSLVWLDGPEGKIPAVGVPSASAALPDPVAAAGYALYHIDGWPGAWRCTAIARSYSLATRRYAELSRQILIGT